MAPVWSVSVFADVPEHSEEFSAASHFHGRWYDLSGNDKQQEPTGIQYERSASGNYMSSTNIFKYTQVYRFRYKEIRYIFKWTIPSSAMSGCSGGEQSREWDAGARDRFTELTVSFWNSIGRGGLGAGHVVLLHQVVVHSRVELCMVDKTFVKVKVKQVD